MTPDRPDPTPAADAPIGRVVARGGIGGVLMGLANLVPGISGGTMLLASGIYPAFIGGVAELFTFRFRLRSVVLVGTVVLAAGLSIVTLAATFKSLVVEHQWVMYSLFIGLTLGGVPLIHKRLRPIRVAGIVGAVVGAAVMVGLAIVQTAGAKPSRPSNAAPRKNPKPLTAFFEPVSAATQRNRAPSPGASSLTADFDDILARSLATPDTPCTAIT